MKPLIACTKGGYVVRAGVSALKAGGNAIDATVAAALAWPESLASAGVLVAVGTGIGHSAVFFPAKVPGFGLSRPRRLHLLEAGASSTQVATPSAAQALVTTLLRWGSLDLSSTVDAALAALEDEEVEAPHMEALTLLAQAGVSAFTKGNFGLEAARKHGPISGGLLTRRDMIEARPELTNASGPHHGLYAPWSPVDCAEATDALGADDCENRRKLGIVAIDRRGAIVSAAFDAGPQLEGDLTGVLGVPPNTLLAGQPLSRAKKVGHSLPLLCGAVAGGEHMQIGAAGSIPPLHDMLEGGDGEGSLVLRREAGGKISSDGAASVESP